MSESDILNKTFIVRLEKMTIKEIKKFAAEKGIMLPKKAKKAELIHCIQKAEGNNECYSTMKCDNTDCLWFNDCVKAFLKA